MKICKHCKGTGKEPWSCRQVWHEDMRWSETVAYRVQKVCTKCHGEGKIHSFTSFPKEILEQSYKYIINNMSEPTLVTLGRLCDKKEEGWRKHKRVAAT